VQYFSKRTTAGAKLGSADLYEYFVDNFWFKAAGLEQETINEPLRGEHKADIVIIGGGYAGLSSAFHIQERFPDKKITLLEGACCGYGASGRNGGHCIASDLLGDPTGLDDEGIQERVDVSLYGSRQIRRLVDEHGVDCDLMENGRMILAAKEEEARWFETAVQGMKAFGLEATLLQGASFEAEIRSPRFIAGLLLPKDATLRRHAQSGQAGPRIETGRGGARCGDPGEERRHAYRSREGASRRDGAGSDRCTGHCARHECIRAEARIVPESGLPAL